MSLMKWLKVERRGLRHVTMSLFGSGLGKKPFTRVRGLRPSWLSCDSIIVLNSCLHHVYRDRPGPLPDKAGWLFSVLTILYYSLCIQYISLIYMARGYRI